MRAPRHKPQIEQDLQVLNDITRRRKRRASRESRGRFAFTLVLRGAFEGVLVGHGDLL